MRNLRLISTTAAILLLGASAVSAQSMKTGEMPANAPAAQQNAPAETVAPALKSDQRKAPETTGQAVPTAPEAAKEQPKSQTMDNAPAGAAVKGSSDANGSANVKNKYRAAEGKRGTSAQASADEGAVGGPNRVSHRHYRHYHYRHCWTNIFGYRNCW